MEFNILDNRSVSYFNSEKNEYHDGKINLFDNSWKASEYVNRNDEAAKLINKTTKENLGKSLKIGSFSIDENFNVETIVEFSQSSIICGQELPEKLKKIHLKFNGLCELICNKILMDDLLGKGDGDFLKQQINAKELNKESILKSHLLDVHSIFSQIIAFIFNIYPDNIFSIENQWRLVDNNRVNADILFDGLDKIEVGTTLKLGVLKKTYTSFTGHSLLIKKTGKDEFTFFDPNSGEQRGLSKEKLAENINNQLYNWGGTDIYISKADSYIKRLIDKKIIEKSASIIKSQ